MSFSSKFKKIFLIITPKYLQYVYLLGISHMKSNIWIEIIQTRLISWHSQQQLQIKRCPRIWNFRSSKFSSDKFSLKKSINNKHVVVEGSVIFKISTEYLIIMIGYLELVHSIGWLFHCFFKNWNLFSSAKLFTNNWDIFYFMINIVFTLHSSNEIILLNSTKNLEICYYL